MSLCKVRLKHFPNAGPSVPGCPEWQRVYHHYKKQGIVAQLYKNDALGAKQIDVFSMRPNTPTTVDVLGQSATIWPLSGYALSLGGALPGHTVSEATAGDGYYTKKVFDPWPDVAFAGTAGSPRNEFQPRALTWAGAAGGVSPAMAAYLRAFTEAQVVRPVQDVMKNGLPRALITGQATFPKMLPQTPGSDPQDISPYWTHHLTIDVLCDDFLLTGSPRALDQLTRVVFHLLATQEYCQLLETNDYGRAARVAGWWLRVLSRAIRVYTYAGLIPLRDYLVGVARGHLARVQELWDTYGDWVWGPAKTLPYEASSVFHIAVLVFGCRSLADLGIWQAKKPLARGADWLEKYGWNGETAPSDLVVYYDAAQDPANNTEAGLFGTGVWPWPGLAGMESDLALAIQDWAIATDYGTAKEEEWIKFFGYILQGE